MKWICFTGLLVFLLSCQPGNNKRFTLDLNFTCTPIQYFDTLQTVLLTNVMSDLGGKEDGMEEFFSGGDRIFKKKMTKINGHFYIDSVKQKEYWALLVTCKLQGLLFVGWVRDMDFSKATTDTVKLDLCIKPGSQYINP